MLELVAILNALGLLTPLQVFFAGILSITAIAYLLRKM